MKVAVNLNTKTIVDILPDSADVNNGFLRNNGYGLLDIENPILESVVQEDGSIEAKFRGLTGEELAPYLNAENKKTRAVLVGTIEVLYQGIVYQGDETSQDRMSRAINGLPDNVTTILWKAKDNSSQELTRLDLKEILFLSIQEQTRILFSRLN